jgi:hypothetical protein
MIKRLPIRRRWLLVLATGAIVYLMLAYVVLPVLWTHHEHEPGLVLLRHKFIRTRRVVEARQHGHRGRRLTRASMMRRRTVAIEFGTWRSGRNGGSSGSVTVGYGKLREARGGTRS